MKTAVVTGATGFIGRAVSAAFRDSGWRVIGLSRTPGEDPDLVRWELGEELPLDMANVDCFVHLACATLGVTTDLEGAARADIDGTDIILKQVRRTRGATGRPLRFLFVSSQSARPEAGNVYGRSKWQIEALLDRPDEMIVRPGLVFGDSETGVYGIIRKLVRLPVLPRLGGRPAIGD